MKLRYQIAILLMVPLVLQLVFGAVLLDNLAKVDSAAAREASSKQIIAACLDVRAALVQYLSFFRARHFFDTNAIARLRKEVEVVVTRRLQILSLLVKDDSEARKLVKKYEKKLRRFEYLMSDAGGSFQGGMADITLARFVHEGELFEEIVATFNEVIKIEKLLVAHFRPVHQALNPESVKARQEFRNLVVFAGAFDTLIVIILAVVFGQKTLRRLAVLMSNIDQFSKGSTSLAVVGGNDEVGELDSKFREMAEERLKAEEMKRALMAMVSHDLRSPLTSVGLSLTMILEMYDESLIPKVKEKIRKSDSEIQRLCRLADGLLEIEKIESGRLQLSCSSCPIADVIEPAMEAMGGIAESKKMHMSVLADSDLEVYCDSDRIIQVLVNLMSNAIKFSPTESTLTVKVLPVDNGVRFEVIDQGAGVAPEDEPKLFLRFSQLEQSDATRKVGSGLGLYITRMIVESHGGQIGYFRPQEGGSCFWFFLKSKVSPPPNTVSEPDPQSQ
ncbi:MAG: HAMP domain-containing histidine kinase [Cyanobacteria bacterium]|nr:HAMP domain-containing histidine kinase [Cyanobacteriota bacterium]